MRYKLPSVDGRIRTTLVELIRSFDPALPILTSIKSSRLGVIVPYHGVVTTALKRLRCDFDKE